MKRNLSIFILSVLASAICATVVTNYFLSKERRIILTDGNTIARNVNFTGEYPDFTYAAENSVDGVVYVKVLKRSNPGRESSILEYFFGYPNPYSAPRESINSGSGVIISPDGYIVTNNHVVEGASEIAVITHNNKSYTAKIVGTDPVTDIALIKVDGENLPVIPMGSSEDLRLGEWVLAIGSPYDLRSTITAGIVSAKGRSLPNARGEFKIESFIQTDAAVNPGNSGGALVNIKGELVGINTAIASNTGSYTGYSFAVPTAIVKKVVADIKEFGSVQRAMLGVSMQELTDKLAKESGIEDDFYGVYVAEVASGGAAEKAGIKSGDIIVSIDNSAVKTPSDIQEKINGYRPDDEIAVTLLRDGKSVEVKARLQGRERGYIASSGNGKSAVLFGAELQNVSEQMKEKSGIDGGVQVVSVGKGKIKDAGIRENFIITHINQEPVATVEELMTIVGRAKRSLLVEGIYPNGSVFYYAIGL